MSGAVALTLYGPMCSWGTEHSATEERGSADRPTKSAVIGLMAACLGIDREDRADIAALSADLSMLVAVVQPGSVMFDYHTVASSKPKAKAIMGTRADELNPDKGKVVTFITRRAYRQDAAYVVALQSRRPGLIAQLTAAMERPAYMPFLGRKSCPMALPMGPRPLAGVDLVSELLAYAAEIFPAGLPGFKRPATVTLACDDDLGIVLPDTIVATRRDAVDKMPRGYLLRQELVGQVAFPL